MRSRKQNGQIIRIGDRWYVRYWEHRSSGGKIAGIPIVGSSINFVANASEDNPVFRMSGKT